MPQLDLGKVVGDTGPQGPKGDQGTQGPAGQTGPGVAVGGSANQVLVKHSGTNYDTQWVDAGNLPSIAGVQDAIAIVANGDTHPAIASGQFVYVRNHSTLAEGLYKATAAIGTDVALTTSNLTADGSGGLNDLKGQIDSLNSNKAKITFKNEAELEYTIEANNVGGITLSSLGLLPPNNVAILSINTIITGTASMAYADSHLQGMGGSLVANDWAVVVRNSDSTAHTWKIRIVVWYVQNYAELT